MAPSIRKHHAVGPSALDSLSRCVRFKYNDSDEDAATEGTLLHKAFETGDLTGLDDEQKTCVMAARNYVESLKFEDGLVPSDWEDLPEQRVELEGLTFGTADRLLLCRKTGTLHVIDAKFTRVEKDHSMQLRTYGAAFAEACNRDWPDSVKTVITHVVAPRIGPAEPEVYDASILVAETRQYLEELYAKVEDPFEPPTPHEDLCLKCARAARCPALGAVVKSASRGVGLPLPSVFDPESMVSVRDRAVSMVLAGALVNWGEQVKKANLAFVAAGGEIPGYRLQKRNLGMRVPKEHTADAVRLLENSGLDKSSVLGCCSLTVGDVVEAVSTSEGVTEAEAKERVRGILADVVSEGSCSFLQKEKRIADADLLVKLVG